LRAPIVCLLVRAIVLRLLDISFFKAKEEEKDELMGLEVVVRVKIREDKGGGGGGEILVW